MVRPGLVYGWAGFGQDGKWRWDGGEGRNGLGIYAHQSRGWFFGDFLMESLVLGFYGLMGVEGDGGGGDMKDIDTWIWRFAPLGSTLNTFCRKTENLRKLQDSYSCTLWLKEV